MWSSSNEGGEVDVEQDKEGKDVTIQEWKHRGRRNRRRCEHDDRTYRQKRVQDQQQGGITLLQLQIA